MRFPALLALVLAPALAGAQLLPLAPVRNVQESFFGTAVDDPYRYFENLKDPEVSAWMKAHADSARRTLDSLPAYASMLARVAELDDAVAARIGSVQRVASGRLFYTRRGAEENTFKLYTRKSIGTAETRLADPDDWQKRTGKPHAINYFAPSRDGRHVAFGVSESGSEDASIYVMEVATGKLIGKPIDRAQYPEISWRPDNRSFFFLREQKLEPGMAVTERYQKARSYLYALGADPDKLPEVLGIGNARVKIRAADFPYVVSIPGSNWAIALVQAGVQREFALYAAPLAGVGKPDTPWVKICDEHEKVTDFAVRGDDIYLRTHRRSPRHEVVRTSLRKPSMANAESVVPATDLVLDNMALARDALYLEYRDGAVKRLKRLAFTARAAMEDVTLPFTGSISLVAPNSRLDGVLFSMMGWERASQLYRYDPKSRQVTNTGLQPRGKFDLPPDLVATEVRVRSHDGAMVPLSIVHKKGLKLDGSNPALLYGYGSYGISENASFIPRRLAWIERGGVFAVANVRGSGAYGEEWYKAGYKGTKPNTWADFIACAEFLVKQGYTSSPRLGILGGSAGGILVGRALTERPDLFGAAVPVVGVLDAVRAETTANGVPNIPEFGTVKKEDEFRALLAMSAFHHVKDGIKYPAVMLPHGFNDPRVDVWHSAKMAARLMAANPGGNPVLLNIDYESGHGVGSTKKQSQRQTADIYSFLLWQAGDPAFQLPVAR